MELIHFVHFVGWTDCPPAFPSMTHLPQVVLARKGLKPGEGCFTLRR
jgi:hypothetical protein